MAASTDQTYRSQKALDYVFGYTCANDVSARDWQRDKTLGGGQFARGKSFDGFCPLGPWIVTKDEIPDYGKLNMRAFVNGEKWSDGVAGKMQHSFESMIAYASKSRTLFPGDVLGSGTVGGGCGLELDKFLKPGDTVRLEIDGLGALENRVEYETAT